MPRAWVLSLGDAYIASYIILLLVEVVYTNLIYHRCITSIVMTTYFAFIKAHKHKYVIGPNRPTWSPMLYIFLGLSRVNQLSSSPLLEFSGKDQALGLRGR